MATKENKTITEGKEYRRWRKKKKQSMASNFISIDEAALYDRQIRLWGVEAQQR